MSNFEKALSYTLVNEGGFTNNPNDPGGSTNFGVTSEDLARHRMKPVTSDEVKAMTREEACDIYLKNYWTPLGLDQLKEPAIATAVFDIAVNRGMSAAIKCVQSVCKLPVDGHMGPMTISSLNYMGPDLFLARFVSLVEHGYVELVLQLPEKRLGFLAGWSARAMRLLTLMEDS